MLSILIPTYNYNISPLVSCLHSQCSVLDIEYEIIILEDGSHENLNSKLEGKHTKIISLKTNTGRVNARQKLAEEAKFNWLLFLDADVLPKNENFVSLYLKSINDKIDAVFGGYAYKKNAPKKDYLLRWKYGKNNEQVSAKKRNQKPYKVIIFGNFLIKKSVFIKLNSKIDCNLYGEDNHFGVLLKTNKHKILHIDNEVYHLGIDANLKYLDKQKESTNSLLHLYANNNSFKSDNDLLNFFILVKKLNLTFIFYFIFKNYEDLMQRNLTSNNPSIFILQLYRISFMCYSETKKTHKKHII